MTTTPTTRAAARAAAKADAKNRAGRTLWTGLLWTGVVAAAAAANGVVSIWTGKDVLDGGAWVALGTAVALALLNTITSYVARLKVPPAV